MELFANDTSTAQLEQYEDELRFSIAQAQAQGSQVIINITNRNESFDKDDNGKAKFEKWRNLMYTIAKETKCVLIDFDKLLGGHTKAFNDGLIQDSIHPNYYGHRAMAHILNNLLFGSCNIETVRTENTWYDDYGYPVVKDHYVKKLFVEDIQQRVYDSGGNYSNYRPLLAYYPIWEIGQLPKYALQGNYAFHSGDNLPYFNLIDCQGNKKLAVWKSIKELIGTLTEVITSKPDTIIEGKHYLYRKEGADDVLLIGMKKADGTLYLGKIATEEFTF